MVNDYYVFKTSPIYDHRGYFKEAYKQSIYGDIKQVNVSYSHKHTLRGIHQAPYAKIVSCVSGSIFDVCVDLRKDSSTYLQHEYLILSSKNQNMIYIPPYCGHAFLALKDSLVLYYQTEEYNTETNINYCYKNYNIEWPIPIKYISNKDERICNEMA